MICHIAIVVCPNLEMRSNWPKRPNMEQKVQNCQYKELSLVQSNPVQSRLTQSLKSK